MAAPYVAFCWASGLIQFGMTVPSAAFEICRGARTTVVREVTAKAQQTRDGALTVPGWTGACAYPGANFNALRIWLAQCGSSSNSRFITWSNIDAFGEFRDPKEIDRVANALLAGLTRQVNARAGVE